jgi:hypothetical protein
MSVDLYILLPQKPKLVTPASIGLDRALFPWPDAARSTGWSYPDAGVKLTVMSRSDLSDSWYIDEHAPGEVGSAVFYEGYWASEGFEHTIGHALGGIALSDIELSEDPDDDGGYEEEEEDDEDGDSGHRHPYADSWGDPGDHEKLRLRARLLADRYRPDAAHLAQACHAALDGSVEALHVLDAWVERAGARIRGHAPAGARETAPIAAAITPALLALVDPDETPALAKLVGKKR